MIQRLLRPFIRIMGSIRWLRVLLQKLGVNVTPMNFYSNLPSVAEIESSFEYAPGTLPYLDARLFDNAFMAAFLENHLMPHAAEFDPPVDGEKRGSNRFFWKAGEFSYSDAMSYYCMIRHLKPGRILEIGSGFSSLVAAEALGRNGKGDIICIEPYPRGFLKNLPRCKEIVERKVQDVDPSYFTENLRDGDILFVDSTHTVKSGSDCLYIYLKVIPQLKAHLFIHVHDVFLPEALPKKWLLDHYIFWTEQYLLLAYLLDNPLVSVLYGSRYHSKMNPELLKRFMGGKQVAGGSSFWFERRSEGA